MQGDGTETPDKKYDYMQILGDMLYKIVAIVVFIAVIKYGS